MQDVVVTIHLRGEQALRVYNYFWPAVLSSLVVFTGRYGIYTI